jgi:hypothetical protein
VEPANTLGADVILDGEIIAFAEGKKLTFFDLQKRLGRRNEGDLFLGPSIPVRFVAFDLLWKDGLSLIDEPLRERREQLESLEFTQPFQAIDVFRADSPDAIEEAFKAARLRDNEGLIAKDPNSLYSPGRRGLSWLKLKKAMATLDCVVVKAEEGHGKRSHVLSDYTFAVRDDRTDELVVIGTGDIRIVNLTTPGTTTIDVTDASQVTVSGASITITPTAAPGSGRRFWSESLSGPYRYRSACGAYLSIVIGSLITGARPRSQLFKATG